MGWNENSSLSNWVSAQVSLSPIQYRDMVVELTLSLCFVSQRQDYKLYNKGRPSRLTAEKIAKLDAVGFVWEAQRGGRRRKLEPLIEPEDEKLSPTALEAMKAKADPPGEVLTGLNSATAEARGLVRRSRPQGMPPALTRAGSNVLPQQALLMPGAVGNPLLESQQLKTPLQQRQVLSQMGTPSSMPPGMAMPGAGTPQGPSPMNMPTEVLLRLQMQEQRDRATLAALAARDNLMGIPTGIPSLPFGPPSMIPGMFNHLVGGPQLHFGQRMPPGRGFIPPPANPAMMQNSSASSRERKGPKSKGGMPIGELFDPSLPDPHDERAFKRAKLERKSN